MKTEETRTGQSLLAMLFNIPRLSSQYCVFALLVTSPPTLRSVFHALIILALPTA